MLWFKRKTNHKHDIEDQEAKVSLDVTHHKRQSAKVVAETRKAVNNLNRELKKNNITIRISVATGGPKR